MSIFSHHKTNSYLGVDLGTKSIKFVELDRAAGRPRLVTYGLVEMDSNVSREESKESLARVADIFKKLLGRARARSRQCVAALPNFSVFSSVITLPQLGKEELAAAVQWEAKKFIPMPLENVVLEWKILGGEGSQAATSRSEPAPASAPAPTPAPASETGVGSGPGPGQTSAQSATASSGSGMAAPASAATPAAPAGNVPAAGAAPPAGKATRVLLTAAPKYLVQRYVTVFKQAGVNLLSLETESFALARSLVGNEPYVVLIADVGSLTTDLTVVEQGAPVLSRSIDVGGKTVTKAIADGLGVDEARAEQFKRDVGVGAPTDAAGGGEGVGRIINQSFSAVVNEMKYALSQYQGQGAKRVEKILLTGGSSWLPGLSEYLSGALGIKTFIANPWARIAHPKDLAPVLETVAPRMAIAVGLAMRELE